ncbi:MAG: hypothetical protein ABID04_03500, partial [Patescibacteria group bacterium]
MFKSRLDASQQLVMAIQEDGITNPIVLSLTPGGAVIGKAIASLLDCCHQQNLDEVSSQQTIVLVDDGQLETDKILSLVKSLRQESPKQIIVALPVCQLDQANNLKQEADRLIALCQPELLLDPTEFYQDFPPVSQ